MGNQTMKMSETIAELATALSKAQGQIDSAIKGSTNPAFKSKYADINSLRDAIREPLAANDLALVQFPRIVSGGIEVETMILHKSGEFMSETLGMPVMKNDPHGVGSAITYARRYGFSAILNLAAEDDDGNAAVKSQPAKSVEASAEDFTNAYVAATEGKDAFNKWWKENKEARQTFSEKQMVILKKATEDAESAN